LRGKVAIANAKLAYAQYQEMIEGSRWKALAARGARPQRLLWASTGTKNPAYPKTMYIDPLIGPDTVNTVPAETFAAFRDTGEPRLTVTEGVSDARAVMQALSGAGISFDEITRALLQKGVAAFSRSFENVLATIERKGLLMRATPRGPAPAAPPT
jgi:transaldolase/glucose-6-phosphate isomerase